MSHRTRVSAADVELRQVDRRLLATPSQGSLPTQSGGSGPTAATAGTDPILSMRGTLTAMMPTLPVGHTPLPSRTGDPILRLGLDRPATVGEVAPHFLPNGVAYLLRQCCECLAS